jgi:hypothetical protein
MYCCEYGSCGLYYKHVTIVNDDSSIINKWSFKLTDDARVIIYNQHRFIIQANTGKYMPKEMILKREKWIGRFFFHFFLKNNFPEISKSFVVKETWGRERGRQREGESKTDGFYLFCILFIFWVNFLAMLIFRWLSNLTRCQCYKTFLYVTIRDDISMKSSNVKININNVCNLISVSSERFS